MGKAGSSAFNMQDINPTYVARSIAAAQMQAPMYGVGFRQTPEGQPQVDELLFPCDTIERNYGEGQLVIRSIAKNWWNGLASWSLELSRPGSKDVVAYINELVSVNGRILKLFDSNTDEIFKVVTMR